VLVVYLIFICNDELFFCHLYFHCVFTQGGCLVGCTVAPLVEALCFKLVGCRFDS
jgi:hypothetical protein